MNSIIEEYPFVTVWEKHGFGVGKGKIVEGGYLCTIKNSLDFNKKVVLSFDDHYHSEQFLAKVKSVDKRNLTGMFHLCEEWSNDSEENSQTLKNSLVGKEMIIEKAHYAGERTIYRSVYPIEEYWSDLELEIGEKIR